MDGFVRSPCDQFFHRTGDSSFVWNLWIAARAKTIAASRKASNCTRFVGLTFLRHSQEQLCASYAVLDSCVTCICAA
jgi:hypothetical protein